MNELNNIIEERLYLLPKVIKEIIVSSDWVKKVAEICKQNKLLLDQETQIENMTIMIMIGALNPRNIVAELMDIGIDREKSIIVAQDLEQQIFSPIMSELVKVFEEFEEQDKAENIEKFQETNPNYISKANPIEPEESREDILKQIEDEDKQGNNIINFIKDDSEKTKQTEEEKKSIVEKLNSPFATKEESVSVNNNGNTFKIDPYRELPN